MEQWQKEQGLPRNSVQGIAQTPDGYLWVGTAEGLARFNGLQFKLFDSTTTPQLKGTRFAKLLTRRDGTLWIGTENAGLVRYSNGEFTCDVRVVGLTNRSILSLFEDRDGSLWIGTRQSLCRLVGNQLHQFERTEGWKPISAFDIDQDARGRIWIASSQGLFCYESNRFSQFTVKDGLASDFVNTVCVDADQSIWAGTERGVCHYQSNQFTIFTTAHGLANSRSESMLRDSQSNLWVGTSWGLNRWNRQARHFDAFKSDTIIDPIQSLCEDQEGNLWIGTEYGLTRLSDSRFRVLSQREGLSHIIFTIYQSRDQSLWFGSWLGGLSRLKNGQIKKLTVENNLSYNIVAGLLEDHEGALWAGTRRGGLNRIKNEVIQSFNKAKDNLSDDQVLTLHEDSGGVLWIGTAIGLTWRTNGVFTPVQLPFFSRAPRIKHIFSDSRTNLWLATDQGLLNQAPGKPWRRFSLRDGLNSPDVYCVFEDRDGTLWIGTAQGICRYRNDEWFTFGRQDGLLARDVIWIMEDGIGNLWYSSSSGIFRISKEILENFSRRQIERLNPMAFTRQDGLRVSEVSWLGSPAGFRTADGRLWFATRRGAAVIDADRLKINTTPPPIKIEKIFVDGQPVPVDRLHLTPDNKRIEFHFAALSYSAPEKNRFKYRLEGLDTDWIDADNRTFAHYANIPHGSYRFHVIGCNNDGVWNQAGAAVSFVSPRHFYETPLSIGVWVAVLLGSAWGVYWWRIRHLEIRESQLVTLVNERTSKLRDEVSERLKLEQQLRHSQKLEAVGQLAAGVAHDFNNILTVIQGHASLLKMTTRSPDDLDSVKQIEFSSRRAADLTRQLLMFSRRQMMQSRVLDLSALVHNMARMLERLLGEQIKLVVQCPQDLPAVMADSTMIEQILLNLAVNARDAMPKGGTLTFATTETVIGRGQVAENPEAREGRFVLLRSIDTGCGMDAATASRIFEPFFTTKEVGKGTGLGLATVYGIVKQHEGWIQVQTAPGKGTTFDIFLPAADKSSSPDDAETRAPEGSAGPKSILVVEDEEQVRLLIRSILSPHGYRILEAGSGVEAIRLWQQHRDEISVLITDMVMPEGMTGNDLAAKLEQDKRSLRVILTTDFGVKPHHSDPSAKEGYPTLQKPFEPQTLVNLVREELDRATGTEK